MFHTLLSVFHTVFNTCGKHVDSFDVLHCFPHLFGCFCLYVMPNCCGLPKRAKSGKLKKTGFFIDFFRFFHKSFPLFGCVPPDFTKRKSKKPYQNGICYTLLSFWHIFINRFSTPTGTQKTSKYRYISHVSCLSTVSAGTTNITIYYLFHSFVIYRVARKQSERVPRKEICYEDHIQPPKRKRCSCSLDVCRIR